MTPAGRPDWGLVLPVKRLSAAKTRLAAHGDDGRQRLALAFAQDVVRVAVACPLVRRVLVVTDDGDAAAALTALGADVQADGPDAGLNPALEHGAALLRADDGRLGVAALATDLPSLRPDELAAALLAATSRACVADADGTGTTLLAAPAGTALQPAFGPGSAARHRRSGARSLPGGPGLRRDVDTPADLEQALGLGVGPSTAAALRALGLDGADPAPRRRAVL